MSDQAFLSTDIGPGDALAVLETHSARITASARWHHQVGLRTGTEHATSPPTAREPLATRRETRCSIEALGLPAMQNLPI